MYRSARIPWTWLIPLALCGVLMTGSAVALAQAESPEDLEPPTPPDLRWERRADHLQLTEEQRAAIAEIREKGRKEKLALRKQMLRLQNELQGELLADEPSEAKVRELVAKQGEIRTQLQQNRLSQKLAIRKLLTAEQRDQLLLREANRRPHGRHGRSGRFGGRGLGCCDRSASWDRCGDSCPHMLRGECSVHRQRLVPGSPPRSPRAETF